MKAEFTAKVMAMRGKYERRVIVHRVAAEKVSATRLTADGANTGVEVVRNGVGGECEDVGGDEVVGIGVVRYGVEGDNVAVGVKVVRREVGG